MNLELIHRLISSFVLSIISLFIIIKGSYFFNFFLFFILLISIYEWHKMAFKKSYYFPVLIFLLISFFCAYLLRSENENLFNFLILIITCISTDIGGYVFGKIFKGPKLTSISPNKTYSGVLGSFFTSFFIVYFFIHIFRTSFESILIYDLNLIFDIFFISLISQLGDLIVSYFKRLAKIKDTGNIIPGHGGILDRIDGMIFVFPVSYFLNIL